MIFNTIPGTQMMGKTRREEEEYACVNSPLVALYSPCRCSPEAGYRVPAWVRSRCP